ncbi:MAG: SAM-dependent methyltransferase [Bdellovibrionales bacterium]
MDAKTIQAYDRKAQDYSQEWLNQPVPTDVYQLLENFFMKGGKTLDVGCGNGRDTLPELAKFHEQFSNVFCETVIMRLPHDEREQAVRRLRTLTASEGILYLSWRVTEGQDVRDSNGRLYSAFDSKEILQLFFQDDILHFEDRISQSSAKRVCRLIVKVT